MTVTTATDDSVETTWMCDSCPITMKDCTLLIDIIFIPFKKIDVVLGMDFLHTNLMCIGCKEKTIFIPKEAVTMEEVIYTLLEGIINMIRCLFLGDKSFILILTIDSDERMIILQIRWCVSFQMFSQRTSPPYLLRREWNPL